MQNLKTVDFDVAFTLTRPAPADYEDKDGNTQTAAANEPRFNYSNGVAQGLLLDASLSETAAINDVPLFNSSAGHWVIDGEFFNSEPLKGMGLGEVFRGSGKMVVSYSGGTAKVWAGGQAVYTVASYTPVEPTHICEGGMVTIAGLTYKPSAISDADAAALATGDFDAGPFDPLTLFSDGQQGAWYDPSDLTTLFQDAAGTIPVTADGDPVGLMLDKSGNGLHASRSTTASKPVYRTNGALHWIKFDGADDFLELGSFALSGDIFINVAYDTLSDPAGLFLRSSSDTGTWYDIYGPQGSVELLDNASTGVFVDIMVDGAPEAPTNRGDMYNLLYGRHVHSSRSNEGDPRNGPWLLGALMSGSSNYNLGGNLYGYMLVDQMTENDRILTQKYLANKAGVTLS